MASGIKKAKLAVDAKAREVTAKNEKPSSNSGSDLLGGVAAARQFLKEVAIEFNKITWPGRTQVIQETYSVLFLVTVITLMVLSFDWFLGKAIFGPLEYLARLHGGGVGRG